MTVQNLLKTPDEFVTHYSDKIHSDLSQYNTQINKLGYIGFLFNVMGNTQFDAKQYYNYLFKESFVATSREESNLYMHSSIHGYTPDFATASTAVGDFVFDFSLLPSRPANVTKREIIVSNITFKLNNVLFSTDGIYKFVDSVDGYYASIYTLTGYNKLIASQDSRIVVPFYNVFQYESVEELVQIPNYNIGDYYPINVTIPHDIYIKSLQVEIRDPNETYPGDSFGEEFDLKFVKFTEDAFSKIVFIKPISTSNYLLELGSGHHGKYVPNTMLRLVKELTFGTSGNLNIESSIPLDQTSRALTKLYNIDGTVSASSDFNYLDICKAEFKYSSGGKTPLSGVELQTNIIKYIQTRNNLLTELDYNNLESNDEKDFKFLFKKTTVHENIFYLYKKLLTRYMTPVKTLNHSIQLMTVSSQLVCSYEFEDNLESTLSANTDYRYDIYSSDSFNYSESTLLEITNPDPFKQIHISWESTNSLSYIIKRTNQSTAESNFFSIFECEFVDDGSDGIDFSFSPIIFKPQYLINDKQYISPFIYKYNKTFRWYDGYIFYDIFTVSIARVINNIETYDLPVFFVNLTYDYENDRTIFYLKSTQKIDNYYIEFDCNKLNLYDIVPDSISDDTFRYYYHNSIHGLIFEEFEFSINVYTDSTKQSQICKFYTEPANQIIDISDQLKLITFKVSEHDQKLLNIPMIDYEVYSQDIAYYSAMVQNYILDNSFSENRLPGDEIQYRFLNTGYVEEFYFKHISKQHYNHGLQLPLRLKIDVLMDEVYLSTNEINLADVKESMYADVASLLQTKYSGTNVVYFDSQIVDFIHTGHPYFKQVSVETSDSDGYVLNYGLEILKDPEILSNIQNDISLTPIATKYQLVKYTPVLLHWDVDNISITFKYL